MYTEFFLVQRWAIVVPIFASLVAIYLFCTKNKDLFKPHPVGLFIGLAIATGVWYWFGCRYKFCYQDSCLYAQIFYLVQSGEWLTLTNSPKEWFWSWFEYQYIFNSDLRQWYFGIAAFYIGGMSLAAFIWMRNNFLIAITFIFTSFGFFSYGTNGLRNGMALSLCMLGLSIISTNVFNKKLISYLLGFTILYLASATHQSSMLMIGASILSLFYRNSKSYFIGWTICVFLSLVATGPMQSLFGSLIDDGRMQNYIDNTEELNRFSRTGFRWDFILFSMVPMVLGWYILFIKKIQNQTYIYLLNIYIIANAFWACVNSMPYSNRLAQLSWFLTPVLIAYPLLTLKVFKQQGTVLALFLLGYVGFGALMGY